MYAITSSSFRVIDQGMSLAAGETRVQQLPQELLTTIRGDDMRRQRVALLRASDWAQMDDAPLTALEKAAYQTYRQALRDLPSVPGFPDVPWPTLPTIRDGTASSGDDAAYP